MYSLLPLSKQGKCRNDANKSDLIPLNKDTIASQPVVSTVAGPAVGVQNTLGHSCKTESPAITFWTTDFVPNRNILEVVSHPTNSWMNKDQNKRHHQVNSFWPLCYIHLVYPCLTESKDPCTHTLLHDRAARPTGQCLLRWELSNCMLTLWRLLSLCPSRHLLRPGWYDIHSLANVLILVGWAHVRSYHSREIILFPEEFGCINIYYSVHSRRHD